jgi:cytidylate kinase
MSQKLAGITVAISRQRGSGGAYIGRGVAERLGLRYFDRQLLRTAAEYFSDRDSAAGDKRRTESWFDRLGGILALGVPDAGYVPPSAAAVYEGELLGLESRLVREIVEDHVSVIVGRGAAQSLREHPRVVTVFIHAPEAFRVARVQQVYEISDPRAALQMVRQSDRDRAAFVRSTADIEWTDARGYDLAIDSSTIGLDAAVDTIVAAVVTRGAERSSGV